MKKEYVVYVIFIKSDNLTTVGVTHRLPQRQDELRSIYGQTQVVVKHELKCHSKAHAFLVEFMFHHHFKGWSRLKDSEETYLDLHPYYAQLFLGRIQQFIASNLVLIQEHFDSDLFYNDNTRPKTTRSKKAISNKFKDMMFQQYLRKENNAILVANDASSKSK